MNADAMTTSKSPETRTRRPKSITRSVILERAYDMYVARELVHGDERLSLVLDSLGYTTGAGYQIWPNQAAFRLELQVYIAERVDYASLQPLLPELMKIRERDLPFDEHVLAIAELYYDYLVHQEEFYLVLRFFAMNGDRPPEITEALRRSYETLGEEVEFALEANLERLGYRVRADRTVAQLSSTMTALAEGFALRERVGPSIEPVEIAGAGRIPFAAAMLAVVKDYTEPI